MLLRDCAKPTLSRIAEMSTIAPPSSAGITGNWAFGPYITAFRLTSITLRTLRQPS